MSTPHYTFLSRERDTDGDHDLSDAIYALEPEQAPALVWPEPEEPQ